MDVLAAISLTRSLRLAPKTQWRDGVLTGPVQALELPPRSAALLPGLQDWTPLDAYFAQAFERHGMDRGGAVATGLLATCREVGGLDEGFCDQDRPEAWVRVVPGSGLAAEDADTKGSAPYRWSDGLSLTPTEGGWRLYSPFASGAGWLSHQALARLRALQTSDGWTPSDGDGRALADLLLEADLLRPVAASHPDRPLDPVAYRLHAMSRRGTALETVGATGSDGTADRTNPASHPRDQRAIALPRPARLPQTGLHDLLSTRQSHRPTCTAEPIQAADVGALLWTAARDLRPPRRDTQGFERRARPYPSAGGCHELDLYLALSRPDQGLPTFARYDATDHALAPLDQREAAPVAKLLVDAGAAMGTGAPSGVIILAARFDRIARKYGKASYPLILKDTGVLLQTLHLTATALGIGSCILGGGDSRAFARATRLDPCRVGPVGELALTGTRAFPHPQETET